MSMLSAVRSLSSSSQDRTLLSAGMKSVQGIGCSMNAKSRTVFVSGNFEGDSTRLGVVIKQSSKIAAKAAMHGNTLTFAFLGNVVPDLHADAYSDSLTAILEMKKNGIHLAYRDDSNFVSPEDVYLIVGARELAWLRLANSESATREIARYDSPDAADILTRPTPFAEARGLDSMPSWSVHNSSISAFPEMVGPDEMAVAMFLKLVSMATLTMRAPGLVRAFSEKLSRANVGDSVSHLALRCFLDSFGGTVQEGVLKLFDDDHQLTIEGLSITPASRDVVDEVLRFAKEEVNEYMNRGSLIDVVGNESHEMASGSSSLWLIAHSIHNGHVVGRLPVSVDAATLDVVWTSAQSSKISWKNALNAKFHDFHRSFMDGVVDRDMYEAFVAMSISSSRDTLPLNNLRSNTSSCCQGVCSNVDVPFGTVQRRILVDGARAELKQSDLVSVLEKWNNLNTDAYSPSTFWSICSWCDGTQVDIEPSSLNVNLSLKIKDHLYDVSVTLASLISAKIKGVEVNQYGVKGLNGIVGPVLSASGNRQEMRVVSFTHDELDTAFVVLLPEAFVRHAICYYDYNYEVVYPTDSPMIAVEGFICLPDESVVPLSLPGSSEAEASAKRSELGTRIWALPKKRSESGSAAFTASDYACIAAMATSEMHSGEITIPGHTIFHTRQTDTDAFAGLNVGLAHVPGMARVTLDTDLTEYQSLFRVVASRT